MLNKIIKIAIVIIPLILLLSCLYKYNMNNNMMNSQLEYLNNPNDLSQNGNNGNTLVTNKDNDITSDNKSNIGGYNIYEKETFIDFGKIFGGNKSPPAEVPAVDVYANTNKYIGETPPFADLEFEKYNTSNQSNKNGLYTSNATTDIKPDTKLDSNSNNKNDTNNASSTNTDTKNMDVAQMLTIAKELRNKLAENSLNSIPKDDAPEIYETHAKISQVTTSVNPVVTDPDEKLPKYNIENSCRFFPDDKCPADYPIFSGASLAISGDSNISINCNGNTKKTGATAFAYIEDGTISDIILINKGKGYKKPPKITVVGGRSNDYLNETINDHARLQAEINDDGEIEVINIINKGRGYTKTPTIVIDPPKGNNECHMCCKRQ